MPLVTFPVGVSAPQPDTCRVDRFLAKGPEAFALERSLPVTDVTAAEEDLQPVVRGAGQDHASQDFAALLCRELRSNCRTEQKSVTGVGQLLDGGLQPLCNGHPRGGFVVGLRRRGRCQPAPQLAPKGFSQRVDRLGRIDLVTAGRTQRLDCRGERKREPLRHERREAAREIDRGYGRTRAHVGIVACPAGAAQTPRPRRPG